MCSQEHLLPPAPLAPPLPTHPCSLCLHLLAKVALSVVIKQRCEFYNLTSSTVKVRYQKCLKSVIVVYT